jgi:hypothetical protein
MSTELATLTERLADLVENIAMDLTAAAELLE